MGVGIFSGVGLGVSSGDSIGGGLQQQSLRHLYIYYQYKSSKYMSAYKSAYNNQ